MTTVALPDKPQTRATLNVTPMNARVFLTGTPKAGKSTLLGDWNPAKTLIIDTQHGTDLLEGEHFVQHVGDWDGFARTVDLLVAGDHPYECVGLDLVDDVWTFCDAAHAGKGRTLATATDDYGRSGKNAEGAFRATVGKLLSTSLGVWFVSHAKTVEDGGVTRYVAKLDGKVVTYVQGATQFVFLCETLGSRRQLHTAPSGKFEAGSRVPLPSPMAMDARELYRAMAAGLGVS